MSWFFLRPREWITVGDQKRQEIGQVLSFINDANKQEDGKLLWFPLRKGMSIYVGDKIKTSGLSSVVIALVTGSKIEIEENTTIKMEGLGKKLSLNMLEGRVFLNQTDPQAEKVDLISGGKKVEVEGSVAVSVNKDGSSVVDNFGQTNEENPFQDLRPNYGEEVISGQPEIEISWKENKRTEEVFIQVGESPVLMSKSEKTTTMDKSKFAVGFRPGVNYWKLTSVINGREVSTPIMKLNVLRPIPPTIIFPAQGDILNIKEKTIDFKWARGNSGREMFIEISKDPQFLSLFDRAELKDQTFYTSSKFFTEGDYFWRIRIPMSRKNEWLESKITNFKVVHAENFISPAPISPVDGAIFYLTESQESKIKFDWKKQTGARLYELSVIDGTQTEKYKETNEGLLVEVSKPGIYQWYVQSESEKGDLSSYPIKRKFEVRARESIAWNMNAKSFLFLDSFPLIILQWMKGNSKSFILKISSRADLSESETFQVMGKDFPYRPSREGFHFAKVIGLDESGQHAGESAVYEFAVEKAPLPPMPVVGGDRFQASAKGNLSLTVKNYKDSWQIHSRLVNSKGVVIDERKYAESEIHYRGLLPGQYILQLMFLDQYKRKSDWSESVEIQVPDKSLIAAPKIKGIKVR